MNALAAELDSCLSQCEVQCLASIAPAGMQPSRDTLLSLLSIVCIPYPNATHLCTQLQASFPCLYPQRCDGAHTQAHDRGEGGAHAQLPHTAESIVYAGHGHGMRHLSEELCCRVMAMSALLHGLPPSSYGGHAYGPMHAHAQSSVELPREAFISHVAVALWALGLLVGALPWMGGAAEEKLPPLAHGGPLIHPLDTAADLVASVCEEDCVRECPDIDRSITGPPGGESGSLPPPATLSLPQASRVMVSVLQWADGLAGEVQQLQTHQNKQSLVLHAPNQGIPATEVAGGAWPLQRPALGTCSEPRGRASDSAQVLAESSVLSLLDMEQRMAVFVSSQGHPLSCADFVAGVLRAAMAPPSDASEGRGHHQAGGWQHVSHDALSREASLLEDLFSELDRNGDGLLSPGEGLLCALQVGVDGGVACEVAAACQPMGHALLLMDQHDKGAVDRFDLQLFLFGVLSATADLRTQASHMQLGDTQDAQCSEDSERTSSSASAHYTASARSHTALHAHDARRTSVESQASDASSVFSWALSDSETEQGEGSGRDRRFSPRRSTGGAGGVASLSSPPLGTVQGESRIASGPSSRELFAQAGQLAGIVMRDMMSYQAGHGLLTAGGAGSSNCTGVVDYCCALQWYLAAQEGTGVQELIRTAVHVMPVQVFRERALDVFAVRGASPQSATAAVTAMTRRLAGAGHGASDSVRFSFDDFSETVFRLAVLARMDDGLGGIAEAMAWCEASPVRTALLQCLFHSMACHPDGAGECDKGGVWTVHPQSVLDLLWDLLGPPSQQGEGGDADNEEDRARAAIAFQTMSSDGWRVRKEELFAFLQQQLGGSGAHAAEQAGAMADQVFAEFDLGRCGFIELDAFRAWYDALRDGAAGGASSQVA